MPPTVAILMPCFNHAAFLPAAVASVVAQTFHDWELIIVDNGSSDNSSEVAQVLIKRFAPRPIRLLRREANNGIGAGRNAAACTSDARYFLALDADDLIDAHFLERTVAVLQSDPSIGFVATNVRFFGAEHGTWSGGIPTIERMRYDCRLTVTSLCRLDAWRAVGGFSEDPEWQGYEDWDFWLRVIAMGLRGELLPEPLFWYRRRPGSSLSQRHTNDLVFRAHLVLDHSSLFPSDFSAWASRVQADLEQNQRHDSRWFLEYAILIARHNPRELPKMLLRPAFKAFGPHQQMYARQLARILGISRAR